MSWPTFEEITLASFKKCQTNKEKCIQDETPAAIKKALKRTEEEPILSFTLYDMRVVLQEKVVQVFGNEGRHAGVCQGWKNQAKNIRDTYPSGVFDARGFHQVGLNLDSYLHY